MNDDEQRRFQTFASPAIPSHRLQTSRTSLKPARGTVLKVYTANSGDYKFVTYVVKWKGAEVIVDNPLSESDCDKMSFLTQKIAIEREKMTRSLHFTLSP